MVYISRWISRLYLREIKYDRYKSVYINYSKKCFIIPLNIFIVWKDIFYQNSGISLGHAISNGRSSFKGFSQNNPVAYKVSKNCYLRHIILLTLGPAYVTLASRQNWRQLVVISAYVDASRKFALIGNYEIQLIVVVRTLMSSASW